MRELLIWLDANATDNPTFLKALSDIPRKAGRSVSLSLSSPSVVV
jgi:hypothetical protein